MLVLGAVCGCVTDPGARPTSNDALPTDVHPSRAIDGDVVITSAKDLALLDGVIVVNGSVSVRDVDVEVLRLPVLRHVDGELDISLLGDLAELDRPALEHVGTLVVQYNGTNPGLVQCDAIALAEQLIAFGADPSDLVVYGNSGEVECGGLQSR